MQTSLVAQIIIFMLFLKDEIRIRIITLIIGHFIIIVTVLAVILNATAEHKDALTQAG